MDTQDIFVYCHNRGCIRDDCLRKEVYMPFNVLCKRTTFDCSDKNGYKHFLGSQPEISEITGKRVSDMSRKEDTGSEETFKDSREYIGILNDLANRPKTWFYIEPFAGNTDSLFDIKGDFTKYGTDIDEEKIEDLKKNHSELSKNFQVIDYKYWNKVLLDEKYKGHCVVYCEPPYMNKEGEFSMDEFVKTIEEWSHFNRVFVRMPQKAKNWELACRITSASNMYEVKPIKK